MKIYREGTSYYPKPGEDGHDLIFQAERDLEGIFARLVAGGVDAGDATLFLAEAAMGCRLIFSLKNMSLK